MNWLNIHTSVLDSPEFLGGSPTERATWLCLLRYCAGQENGGTITGCGTWKDRQWQQVARVTLREVTTRSGLWTWDGANLHVTHYPKGKETEVQAKRETASVNGSRGGRPPKITNAETQKKPTLVISAKAEGERKEKGKEGEGEGERGREAGQPNGCGSGSEIPPVSLALAKQAAPQMGVPPEAAESWWLDHDARGWLDGKGQVVKNWRSSLTAYGLRWRANDARRNGASGITETPGPKAPSLF
jgi:hypothetical protein